MKQELILIGFVVIILSIAIIPMIYFINIAMKSPTHSLEQKVKNCIDIDQAEATTGCLKGLYDANPEKRAVIYRTIEDWKNSR